MTPAGGDAKIGTVIVTPVYEDRKAASRLFAELGSLLGEGAFVVAVDDGSVREPLEASDLEGIDGLVLRLTRNMGHQRAIAIGLNYVADHLPGAERVVVMDADGEDIPASVGALLDMLGHGDADVVVAERRRRQESTGFRVFYQVYKWAFRMLTGRRIGFGNFMALRPAAVRRLAAMHELWVHVAACALRSGLRIAGCPTDRGRRYTGESRMSFSALVLHGARALRVFGETVLVRIGMAFILLAALSLLVGAGAILLKTAGAAIPDWVPVALGVVALLFAQTAVLAWMLLMRTGVGGGGVLGRPAYLAFIDAVLVKPDGPEMGAAPAGRAEQAGDGREACDG
ncbi:glycosyltransferase [Thioalkalivibrio thiocyanodenitrificans]|uniref:glycosyltransferase n=1 Tax=Thioalkalivibrio thiocyanodenitrificans TaxID=243063 RepID=UPI00035C90E4|nr:glycosyltransferase [Thioalkalivibrio thiocyanodenitrificans]